jgi:putative transposase
VLSFLGKLSAMPYQYQKLTSEERERVLSQRQARGFPLHAPPHLFRDAGCYFMSAANFEHRHLMASPDRRTYLEARLLQELQELGANIFGWVVLPNHYHVLLGVNELNKVSAAIKGLHGKTSREWNLADGLVGKRRVWYRFSDRKIRDDTHFYRALNYIHFNPVKHGYVESVYDWRWSSVHNYLSSSGRDWLRETLRNYKPDYMGQGWDD